MINFINLKRFTARILGNYQQYLRLKNLISLSVAFSYACSDEEDSGKVILNY